MTRTEILHQAQALITGDRQAQYGDAQDSFTRIAGLWSAYLGSPVSPRDTAVMLVLLKCSRERNTRQADNLIDIAGYAALAVELKG